jgi:hypothetical protein
MRLACTQSDASSCDGKPNVGTRTFEVRCPDSMQQAAAPISQTWTWTDNNNYFQPALDDSGQCSNAFIVCAEIWSYITLHEAYIVEYR